MLTRDDDIPAAVRGRPPSTTREEVSRVAFELFANRSFEATTMNDIASALNIGRRTLFRYFDSKNDLVWGDFDRVLQRLREAFAATSAEVPLIEALTEAVIAANTYPEQQLPDLRTRMTLITTVPALQAHSMLRYKEWRDAIAEFAAQRLGAAPGDFEPQAIGHAALAASTTAFCHWVAHPEEDLLHLLRESYGLLAEGFRADRHQTMDRGI